MKDIDLSILKETPSLTEHITMLIRPLAPLSMVAEMPGLFYKALRKPNEKMLCGVVENVLGWHLSYNDRKKISEEHNKIVSKTSTTDPGSTYIPLLLDYFEIENISVKLLGDVCFYKDLWNKAESRLDSPRHIKSCRNTSNEILKDYNKLSSKKEELNKWFKKTKGKVPMFYTKPVDREYLTFDGYYIVKLRMDKKLATKFSERISDNNICYLGNSEGWIDIKFK